MKSILFKKKFFIVLIGSFAFIIFFVMIVKYFSKSNELVLIEESTDLNEKVEIKETSLDEIYEDKDGNYKNKDGKQIVFNGSPISQLFFSPSEKKVGFMENRDINDKNIPYDQTRILHIGNVQDKNFQEIFHGSFRMGGWEWFSENEVISNSGCGTECQVIYWTNLDSGEKSVLQYGVGYEWSPDKKIVFAYHYSGNYGVVVGNKKGEELFSFVREHKIFYSDSLSWKTKATWSPDSAKLALVIKKENAEKMELLIFDAQNNFKQIHKQDIDDGLDDYDLEWNVDGKSLLINKKEIKI
ncbi:MAG: hypothetical protein ACD_11C00054G0014 [uncultured bacterium]|nr:MAG: hypothetical protein ACD_11C00054G0014 [uncultured bacterium]HBR72088.1 hypothetical protein [Candidatus Moranbacteria bacterium]